MKLVARVALSVTVFGGSLASARPTQDLQASRNFAVEKVILTDGDRDVCVADTTNRPDLVPYFAKTSSEASIQVNLPACDSAELQSVQELASIAVRKIDTAGLKPYIKGTMVICGLVASLGIAGEVTEQPLVAGFAATTPPAMVAKGSWWMGKAMAAKLSGAILACAGAGYYGTKGVKYLMTEERAETAK